MLLQTTLFYNLLNVGVHALGVNGMNKIPSLLSFSNWGDQYIQAPLYYIPKAMEGKGPQRVKQINEDEC